MGAGSNDPTIISDPHSRQTFATFYNILDPHFPRPMTVQEYHEAAKLAIPQLHERYYLEKWKTLERVGLQILASRGHISTADVLRLHPNFANFFDGASYTPVVYVRVAELLPINPLRSANPDVAIFMHRVSITHFTALQQSLELKSIIRGASTASTHSNRLAYQVVAESDPSNVNMVWMNTLSEVYKWPVMADMERLGYNPATIMEEISALAEQSGPDFYKRDSYDWMTSLLISGGRYMKKFDDDKELDDLYFNIFSLMFSPIDDTVGPWFQAPIFNNFDIARGKIATIKYTFLGLPFPILDRIRYKSKMDVWGHFHLIPLSIVRPVQVIPEVKFRTLYEFSPQLSSLGTVEFSRIRAFTVRLKEDPVPKMSGSRKSYWFFGTLRPFGNPLYYIETRLKKVLERNPETRGIIVPEVGRGKSSSKKGEGSSRLAIPRLENPTFDYQYISQSQHAEGSTSRLAKPKKKSPAFADQPLSRYQHAEVMPATPNWLPGDRHPSSQHFRDEVAQIHAWGHSEAPSEQTSESSHTIDKHVIEPVVGHYYSRTPAYALPSYGGYERAVEPVGVDQPPAQHSNQPIDSRLYTPSHQHSKPPVLAGQHGSAQHESTPSHVASFDPVESLEYLEMHLDPVRYGWH